MTWFKVDDKIHDHRKARRAGLAAMGLWAIAGSWAADNLTDGFVPATIIPRWSPDAECLAKTLVAAELWDEAEQDGEEGYAFHGWLDFQPSAAQVKAERDAARERQRRAREAAKAKRHGVSHGPPDPTRPDPTRPLLRRGRKELPPLPRSR